MDFSKFQRSVIFGNEDGKPANTVCEESMLGLWIDRMYGAGILERCSGELDAEHREDLLYDLGDMLCHIARIAAALGEPMDKVAWRGLEYWD